MKIKNQSTKANYLYSVTYNILTIVIPLITTPYIARILGADGMGINTYNLVIATYFANFALLGVNFYGSRSISKYRDDNSIISKVFSEIYIMQIMLTILSTLLYFIYILFVVRDNVEIALIMSINVITSGVSISWFYSGIEYFKATVTRNIIVKIISLMLIFIFVKQRNDLWKYVFISSLGTFLGELYLFIDSKKYVKFYFVGIKDILPHLLPNIKLFIPIIAVSIYRSMDKIMLKLMSDYNQIGFYANSERIIEICFMLLSALGQIMLPRITNLFSNNESEKARRLIYQSFEIVTCMASAMAFGLISVSDDFIPIFLGKNFEPCIRILKLLAINLLFLGWGSVIKAEYLIPREKDTIYIYSCLGGAGVNLVLNLLLIPRLLANGAVIGTICAETMSLLIFILILRHELPIIEFVFNNAIYLLFGFVMYMGTHIVNLIEITSPLLLLIIKLVVGAIIFCLQVFSYWRITNNALILEAHRIILSIQRKLRYSNK